MHPLAFGSEPDLIAGLRSQPFHNLLSLASLQMYTIGDDLQVWESEGTILMRRLASWMVVPGSLPERCDALGAAQIIDQYPTELVRSLMGHPAVVYPIYQALKKHKGKHFTGWYANLTDKPATVPYAGVPRPAEERDIKSLTDLYADAAEMTRPREAVIRQLPDTWVVEDTGQIAAAAIVLSQTQVAAMVGGVITAPFLRGRGYATTLVHAISTAIQSTGKVPCLFYYNAIAAKVYERIGYQVISPWDMVFFHLKSV